MTTSTASDNQLYRCVQLLGRFTLDMYRDPDRDSPPVCGVPIESDSQSLESRFRDMLDLLGFAELSPEVAISVLEPLASGQPTPQAILSALRQVHGKESTSDHAESIPWLGLSKPSENPSTAIDTGQINEAVLGYLSLSQSPQWRATGIRPSGSKPLTIEQVFTDPMLVPSYEDDEEELDRPHRYQNVYRCETVIRNALTGITSVIVGRPGAGKTSVAKWLTLQVNTRQLWGLSQAFYVPLSLWSQKPYHREADSLYRFILELGGYASPQSVTESAAALRRMIQSPANSPNGRPAVVMILDGWDETPQQHRAVLRASIAEQTRGVGTVITTRPSGVPKQLFTKNRYQLLPLTPPAQQQLVNQYFGAAGQPGRAEQAFKFIQSWDTDRSYTSNAFLLALLCRSLLDEDPSRLKLNEPRRRAALLSTVIEGIRDQQHRQGRHAVLSSTALESLEAVATRISFDDGEHRFTFGVRESELEDLSNDQLNAVLESRLLNAIGHSRVAGSKTGQGQGELEFNHATLQDFFAARGLTQSDPERFVKALCCYLPFRDWVEIWRFVVGLGDGPCRDQLWVTLGALVRRSDLAGLIRVTAACLLDEEGVDDGGLALLGRDLRPLLLHDFMDDCEFTHAGRALADLDAPWLSAKLIEAFDAGELPALDKTGFRDLLHSLVVANGRIMTLDDQPELQARVCRVCSVPFQGEYTIDKLRRVAFDPCQHLYDRQNAMAILGHWRDHSILPDLRRTIYAQDSGASVVGCLRTLENLGSPEALAILTDCLLDSQQILRVGQAIDAVSTEIRNPDVDPAFWVEEEARYAVSEYMTANLGPAGLIAEHLRGGCDGPSRDRLLWEVARRSPIDPVLPSILEALEDVVLTEAGRTIVSLAQENESTGVGYLAMSALNHAVLPELSGTLNRFAREFPNDAARYRAVVSLMYFLPDHYGPWIVERISDTSENIDHDEQKACVDVLLSVVQRGAPIQAAHQASRDLIGLLDMAVVQPDTRMAQKIVEVAWVLEGHAVAPLLTILKKQGVSSLTKAMTCDTLRDIPVSQLPNDQVFEVLSPLLPMSGRPLPEADEPLQRAAARLAVHVQADRLAGSRFDVVKDALVVWSRRTGLPVQGGRVLRPGQDVFARKTEQDDESETLELIPRTYHDLASILSPRFRLAFESYVWCVLTLLEGRVPPKRDEVYHHLQARLHACPMYYDPAVQDPDEKPSLNAAPIPPLKNWKDYLRRAVLDIRSTRGPSADKALSLIGLIRGKSSLPSIDSI